MASARVLLSRVVRSIHPGKSSRSHWCMQVLILFLVVTLYWHLGDSDNPADATSIAAILFM